MPTGWKSGWYNLPPRHKKRAVQAVCAYVLLMALGGAYVAYNAQDSRQNWNDRTPHASATLNAYAEETAAADTPDADAPAETAVAETPETMQPEGLKIEGEAPVIQGENATAAPATPVEQEALAPVVPDKPAEIIIIMTDAGISKSLTDRAIDELPPEISLAFSPYAVTLSQYFTKAAAKKHETVILIPMEPVNYPKDDPGPKALLIRASAQQNAEQLAAILSQAAGATAAMNYMGSEFMNDVARMSPVLDTLKEKNIIFIENAEATDSRTAAQAANKQLPYAAADILIDNAAATDAILQQLSDLEKLAQVKGRAVGVAHPFPSTIDALKQWAPTLKEKNIRLAPVSAITSQK
jgi:polysaccharide deacetylase 2 family uncharacterized protein YibQ